MRRCKLVALLLVGVFMITGCQSPEGTEDPIVKDEEIKPQIGMSFDSYVTERWLRDQETFVSTAQELGADVNVQSANGDTNEQISQIEYFIEKKMDVIVIIASDANAMSEVIAKAKSSGIKVICYDRLCLNSNVDLYITFDNEKVGQLMGEAIFSEVGKNANIIRINGPDEDYNVVSVGKGFENECKKNNANVIGSCSCVAWRSEEAYDYINSHLELAAQADAIMCGNDDLAGAAISALSENRMLNNIIVVGQDGDLNACQRIVEGTQLMTVYKPVEKLAKKAAECAVKMANGESLEIVETFSDGTYDVPFIRLDPISVTAKNMDDVVISGGFHLREEVYR